VVAVFFFINDLSNAANFLLLAGPPILGHLTLQQYFLIATPNHEHEPGTLITNHLD
jgi:hypothetical protein